MWGAGWGYWGWGWWFWAFWGIVLFAFLMLIGSWGSNRSIARPEEQILRERYARGEIDKQEFEQRLSDLRRAA